MVRKISSQTMGRSNRGWLKSIFHFSFAEYYNSDNMNFGVLRVLNDDLVTMKEGFSAHHHKDMEIISYVVNGELTHTDSMGNQRVLKRGEVQYMSAGTGILHSEYNLGNEILRFLQIWIVPDNDAHNPNYGETKFPWEDRMNKWLHMVSSKQGMASIRVHQDVNIYVVALEKDKEINFKVDKGRQAYAIQIEGKSQVNKEYLNTRDSLESVEESLNFKAIEDAHIMIIEMEKEGI